MGRYLVIAVALGAVGCHWKPEPTPAQGLYFALEIRRDGVLFAKPQFLAESEKVARLTRHKPGSVDADYQIRLEPTARGMGPTPRFRVALDVSLPRQRAHWDLELAHGELRTLRLGSNPAALEVSLLLMKVDSVEFRTLMDLSERDRAAQAPYSI